MARSHRSRVGVRGRSFFENCALAAGCHPQCSVVGEKWPTYLSPATDTPQHETTRWGLSSLEPLHRHSAYLGRLLPQAVASPTWSHILIASSRSSIERNMIAPTFDGTWRSSYSDDWQSRPQRTSLPLLVKAKATASTSTAGSPCRTTSLSRCLAYRHNAARFPRPQRKLRRT